MHTPIFPNQPVRQLAQLAILIQSAAADLSGYELFFGPDNVEYIREGAAKMVMVMGEAMAGDRDGTGGMNRERRHDLRNHVAVVKGFCDLILMDLPREHSGRMMLEELSGKSGEFVHLLDQHRDAGQGFDWQALAS